MSEDAYLERWRIEALSRSGAVGRGGEPHFDSIARFAASMARAPVGIVSFVDDRACWIKASFGAELSTLPRADSLCAHTIRQTATLWIKDTARDTRVRSLHCVLYEPRIRFYAGAPIVTRDGFAVGAVAVLGYQPRAYDLTASMCLLELARLAGEEISRMATAAAD